MRRHRTGGRLTPWGPRFYQGHPTSLQEAPTRIRLSQLGHGTGNYSGRASRSLF